MATVTKDFRVKAGLVVEGSTATVNTHDIITKEIFDAKGDLIVGTGSNTGVRLAVGATDGHVLTVDSNEATGLKFSAPAAVGSFESSIVFEGATADDYETTVTVTDPTADRTITLPNATGTVVLKDTTDTLTNKTIDLTSNTLQGTIAEFNTALEDADFATLAGTETLSNKTLTSPTVSGLYLSDGSIVVEGATANDHETTVQFTDPTEDRTITFKNESGTVAFTADIPSLSGYVTESGTQTLTNKTLTSPLVSGLSITDGSIVLEGATANDHETTITVTDPTADRTITLPDATGTVALTNNKLDVFAATTSAELISVISDETGTGALVFANTPTLVTPNIGAATGTSLVLSGDLTVNGTTTTINSTEITIDDKNLVLGAVTSPTDAGADGGGLTLKGTTDHTFNWIDATDSWTSSEHMDLASGKVLKINGTEVLSATQYTGNAATVTNGITTASKISELAATSSTELAGVISDETGTGALVFANTPTLVTPVLGAATATSIALTDALLGTATATASTSATTIDTWSATTYSSAKYIVQMKKGTDIEVIELLVTVDGNDSVYLTEYADVISNAQLGTTNAVYDNGNVLLQVTGAAIDTVVKVNKVYIEA
jgi:hypothetical protein